MNSIHIFHGADNKTGTTMITQSIGEYIASKQKNIRVMVVSMHGRSGAEYVDSVGESIEGIRLYLDNRLLNTEKLIKECKKSENFFVLSGVESIEEVRNYRPDMASYLLDSLCGEFDLILVDGGNNIDNALAIGALEYIGNRYCVITQQESILKRYEKVRPIYDKLGIAFSSYIVNKYSELDIYDLRYIEKRLNVSPERIVKIEASGFERQAELERRTLLHFKDEGFCQDIHKIANRILYKAQMSPIVTERKKRWMPFT